MILGIDHVVLAAADVDAAAGELEAKLGLAATGGGRHDALGTLNRLVWLGDAYLELVGVFDRELAGTSWLGQPVLESLDRGGGQRILEPAFEEYDARVQQAVAAKIVLDLIARDS